MRHYLMALNAFRSPKLMLGEAHARRGMATVYCGRGSLDAALSECIRAYEVYEQCIEAVKERALKERIRNSMTLEAQEGIARVLLLRSDILTKMKRDTEALDSMNEAQKMFEELGEQKTPASFFISAGRAAMRRGEMREAERYIRTALKLFKEAEDRVGEVSTLRCPSCIAIN